MFRHFKHLLSYGPIRFKPVHYEYIWFWIKAVSGRNMSGNVYPYHIMSLTNACPQNHNQLFLEHKLESSTMLSFTPASWDGDVVKDFHYDTTMNENKDITGHDSAWMTEFAELKTMLNSTEEKLKRIVDRYPELKKLEVLEKVKLNLNVLLKKGVKKGQAFRLLNSSTAVFLLISPDELETLFLKYNKKEDWYTHVKLYLETSLKDGKDLDNVQYLAQLLDVDHELILKLTRNDVLKEINTRYSTVLLKVKVEYLLSKGLSKHDIACNLETLRISLMKLEKIIDEMEATVGDVSLKMLQSKIRIRPSQRYRSGYNKVYKLLGCSYKDFSELQNHFLNNLNQADSIEVLDYLLDRGIDSQEIIKNPYILGHNISVVRCSFEKYAQTVDWDTCDQRKLLNRIVYDLEYGDDSTTI